MAVSPLFIIRVRRMIERLRDPYGLSDAERLQLSEMLNQDEQVEAKRRQSEQWHVNGLMSMSMDHMPTGDEMWWSCSMTIYRDAVVMLRREMPSVDRYREERWKTVAKARAMNYRDTSILGRAILRAEFGDQHKQSYIDAVFRAFDGLTGIAKLYLEHRGSRSIVNLPRWVESIENVYWPNHPNSFRQGHIEVLSMKLDRLLKQV